MSALSPATRTSSSTASSKPAPQSARIVATARLVRAYARLVSGLVLFAFVLCHFGSHIVLIVSVPAAEAAFSVLMGFWLTGVGTVLLTAAFVVHVLNALWSIYIRRYLRMPAWEIAQIVLGLAIPPLILIHVIGTKIADDVYGTESSYASVLASHWLGPPLLRHSSICISLRSWRCGSMPASDCISGCAPSAGTRPGCLCLRRPRS
jgi:adenylate cyclase